MGTRLNEAAEENDMLESEVIRRALRFYENQNPDGFAAFEDVRHGPAVANVAEIEPEALVEDGDSEPTDELVEEPSGETAEVGEVGTNSEEENVLSGDVYDPCEEGK